MGPTTGTPAPVSGVNRVTLRKWMVIIAIIAVLFFVGPWIGLAIWKTLKKVGGWWEYGFREVSADVSGEPVSPSTVKSCDGTKPDATGAAAADKEAEKKVVESPAATSDPTAEDKARKEKEESDRRKKEHKEVLEETGVLKAVENTEKLRTDLDAHKQETRTSLDELKKGMGALQEKQEKQAGEIGELKTQQSSTQSELKGFQSGLQTAKPASSPTPTPPAAATPVKEDTTESRETRGDVKKLQEDVRRLEQKELDRQKAELQAVWQDLENKAQALGWSLTRAPYDPSVMSAPIPLKVEHTGTVNVAVQLWYMPNSSPTEPGVPEIRANVKPRTVPDPKAKGVDLCPPKRK